MVSVVFMKARVAKRDCPKWDAQAGPSTHILNVVVCRAVVCLEPIRPRQLRALCPAAGVAEATRHAVQQQQQPARRGQGAHFLVVGPNRPPARGRMRSSRRPQIVSASYSCLVRSTQAMKVRYSK